MQYIQIGNRKVAQLGQGTWNMGDSPLKRAAEVAALRRGLELGLSVIDTAEMYGNGRSEQLVGEAIADMRDQTYLVSKVLPQNASTQGTVSACEVSLKRLRVETLDLYLLHWPGRFPLEETAEGFDRLLDQGKIQAWGVSNFDVSGMRELRSLQFRTSSIANQVLYNPEYRGIEFDLLPWCEAPDNSDGLLPRRAGWRSTPFRRTHQSRLPARCLHRAGCSCLGHAAASLEHSKGRLH